MPAETDANPLIRPGANNPPVEAHPDVVAITEEIDGLYAEAKNWADGTAIDSDAIHTEVTRLYDMIGAAAKRADALRTTLNEPYDTGKARVQAVFAELIADTKGKTGKTVLARKVLDPMLAAYRKKKLEEATAAAAAEKAAADKKIADATAAIRDTAGDLTAREGAEVMLKDAAKTAKAAARQQAQVSTGTGLRRSHRATVLDLGAALRHYFVQPNYRHDFEMLVLQLANAEVQRGARDSADKPAIPGIKIIEEYNAR